jgi:hypothetical protein
MEYGENRNVYPVGGGLPVSKYYFMPIHKRLDFTKAFYLLEYNKVLDTKREDWGNSEKYYNEICRCEQCQSVLEEKMINFTKFESDQSYPIHYQDGRTIRRKKASRETKQNCVYHYLLCKRVEFSWIKSKSMSDLLNALIQGQTTYKKCPSLEKEELDYLSVWREILSDCQNA